MNRVIFVVESKEESAPHSAWEPVPGTSYGSLSAALDTTMWFAERDRKRKQVERREYRVTEYVPRPQ